MDKQFEEELERMRLVGDSADSADVPAEEAKDSAEAADSEPAPGEYLPVPEGQHEILLPNVDASANEDESTDFLAGLDRPQELIDHPGIKLIGNLQWSFSFQKREEKSDEYYSRLQDMQELERTKEKKKIPNILRTLAKLRGDAELLNRTMHLLSLVLATESCGIAEDESAMNDHPVIVHMS